MWSSLKQGYSWTALVKNRRKNGDHYWVRANAAPMLRGGALTGYLSVRTKPSDAEIGAADALYKRFKEGQAGGLEFHKGLLVRRGWMRWMSAQQLLPTAWRVRIPMALLGVLMLVCLGLSGMEGTSLAMTASLMGLGLLLTWWTVEAQIVTPLARVRGAAQQVASGTTSDELNLNRCDDIGLIARAISQAGLNLQALMADVREQVSAVQVASKEIAAANADLSDRTEQTASNLEESASAMEELTATVRQNSDTAQKASSLADQTTGLAARGGDAMNNVVTTMQAISESSHKIADIISVIDGIAFQTNILALNAAVEAARAGEQGRGFAVVASEVRSLAGRSAAAAKEIKALIEDSTSKVSGGSHLVANAGETMSEVVGQVQRVNQLIAEITEASKEQTIGIAQVGQAVAQLDEMTQQNAAMVEQSSAAARSMSEQASRLMDAVHVFSG